MSIITTAFRALKAMVASAEASTEASTKTIVVLGAAYGGARAAQILAAGVPDGWRVLLIDRNSHTNHVYILPRLAVLPGHEQKAFVPNTHVFMTKEPPPVHRRLQAHVTAFHKNSVTLSKAFPEHGLPTTEVAFDYAIYALGAQLPRPLNLWNLDSDGKPLPTTPEKGHQLPAYHGEKPEGMEWLKEYQVILKDAANVLVVGGGALGIQFATDIAAVHPDKKVTLLHSRDRLLPRFDEMMHTEILSTIKTSFPTIDVILGERLDMTSVDEKNRDSQGQRIVRTVTGREIHADYLMLCTGQSPNTTLLHAMDPSTIKASDNLAHVLRTMQLAPLKTSTVTAIVSGTAEAEVTAALEELNIDGAENVHETRKTKEEPQHGELEGHEGEMKKIEDTPYPHIFVVGDAADAFGAISAGHTAYFQGEVAARNIIRLIKRGEGKDEEPLELYQPGLPAIKVSLGLGKSIYQSQGAIGWADNVPDDLDAAGVWAYFGLHPKSDDEMYD